MKPLISASIFAIALSFGSAGPAFAQEPTMQQIYQAAESGRMAEAQQMIDKVLRDHPTSGNAHYVHSELLAKQGRYGEARAELDTAEKLAPGLPKVKPQSVEELRQLINSAPAHRVGSGFSGPVNSSSGSGSYSGASSGGGFGWGFVVLIVLGGGIAFLIAKVIRANRANRMNRAMAYGQNPAAGPYGVQGGQPGAPYGPYGPQPYGPAGYPPASGGGLGAGILGGLATGAAVGAGVVAAESLLHHFTDSDRHSSGNFAAPPPPETDYQPFDNMGGDNFGITDNSSSWDDSGSSGGDSSGGSDW